MSGIWTHKDITNDEVIEVSWKIVGHDTHKALGNTELSDLNYVISWLKHVVSAVEGEGNVRESIDSSAGLINYDSLNKWVHES